jgi:hypothetical protein
VDILTEEAVKTAAIEVESLGRKGTGARGHSIFHLSSRNDVL